MSHLFLKCSVITQRNKLLLIRHKASSHFGWYSFMVLLRVGSSVGLGSWCIPRWFGHLSLY